MKKKIASDVDLLTLNIPYEATTETGLEITKPFRQPYGQLFHHTTENSYTHKEPKIDLADIGKPEEGSDLNALIAGKISVTPINLELSSNNSMKAIEKIILSDW